MAQVIGSLGYLGPPGRNLMNVSMKLAHGWNFTIPTIPKWGSMILSHTQGRWLLKTCSCDFLPARPGPIYLHAFIVILVPLHQPPVWRDEDIGIIGNPSLTVGLQTWYLDDQLSSPLASSQVRIQQYWLKFHVQNRSSKYHLFFSLPDIASLVLSRIRGVTICDHL